MKLVILSDNRSNPSVVEAKTEHGLSIYLESPRYKLLLDTGASDLCVQHAEKLGVNLSELDYIFLSHGHNDHCGGLSAVLTSCPKTPVLLSADALTAQCESLRGGLHSLTPTWPTTKQYKTFTETKEADKDLCVITRIVQHHPLPKGNDALLNYGKPDHFMHEAALYHNGLLFTGCAHNGLLNILASCPHKIRYVVGGFHLLEGKESLEEIENLGMTLKTHYPDVIFYTGHCTADKAYSALKNILGAQLQSFHILQTINF